MRWRERKGLAGNCRSGPMARKARRPALVAFFMELAVQRVMQPGLHVGRQFNRLRIAEYFHRQPGLIDHHFTVFTVLKMALKFLLHRRLEFAVYIVGNLANNAFALQFVAPRRKYRSSLWRSLSRARSNRDFTAGIEMPSALAVSSVESSSTSRSTKTTRKSGSSLSMTEERISCISVWAKRCSGLGPQSASSRGMRSSSPSIGSSSENWFGRRLRRRISASFAAMRTSQV